MSFNFNCPDAPLNENYPELPETKLCYECNEYHPTTSYFVADMNCNVDLCNDCIETFASYLEDGDIMMMQ